MVKISSGFRQTKSMFLSDCNERIGLSTNCLPGPHTNAKKGPNRRLGPRVFIPFGSVRLATQERRNVEFLFLGAWLGRHLTTLVVEIATARRVKARFR
jgi:hypothetical protein